MNLLRKTTIILCALGILFVFSSFYATEYLYEKDRSARTEEVTAVHHVILHAALDSLRIIISDADYLLQNMKSEVESSGEIHAYGQALIWSGMKSHPFVQIAVADSTGLLTHSAVPLQQPLNVSDREQFPAHVPLDKNRLIFGSPRIAQATGTSALFLSRRVNKPDGSFGGIVSVGISSQYISNLFKQLQLGPMNTLVLLSKEGRLLARHPATLTADQAATFRRHSVITAINQGVLSGTFESPGTGDGVERIGVFEVLANYPVVVLVSTAKQAISLYALERRRIYRSWAGSFSALTVVALFLLWTRLRRQQSADQQLRDVEEKFRNIVETSPLGIHLYKIDFDNRLILTHANQTADHMLNLNHSMLIGKPIEEAFPALTPTYVPEMYRGVAKRELSTQTFEIPYQDERFFGTYFVTVFGIDHGEVAVFFMDITQRKQMEEELRLHRDRLELLVEERTGDLVAVNEELTAMNEEINSVNAMLENSNQSLEEEIAARLEKETELLLREKQYRAASALLLSSSTSSEEQLHEIVKDALHMVQAPAGYLGLYDEESHTFVIQHGTGSEEISAMGPRPADKGMLGEVFHSGEVLNVSDYHQYPNRLQDPRLDRLRSIIMIPLKKDSRVLGVLVANWFDQPHAVTEDNIEALRQYGNLVSVVLERNDAQIRMARKNLLLQGLAETTASLMGELDLDAVLQNILAKAVDLAGTPHGFVLLINDKDAHEVFFRVGRGRYAEKAGQRTTWRGGVFEEVLRTGDLVVVEEYAVWPNRDPFATESGVTMSMQTPLKIDGRLIGVIGMSTYGEKVSITPEKLASLKQFAIVASIAVKNALHHEEFRKLAYHDTLTGLPNRAGLNLRLRSEMKKARCQETSGTLLFIDLDDLKTVNDTFGHSFGDEVITTAGRQIVGTVGEDAFVSRIGGDEFVVVLPDETDRKTVADIADEIVQALSQEHKVTGQHIHMSASIGVTIYPDDGNTPEDILKNADSAMYSAKSAGRNCWRFYQSSLSRETYEKMVLTNSLRRALERNELLLHYQPIITADGARIVGFEALLRWNSPEHGSVPPARFIPYAEQSGLIKSIGCWVLAEACQFARRLTENGLSHLRVAVNISPRQLAADDFVDQVQVCVAAAGIETSQLEIEVTENVLIESMEDSIHKLEELRTVGIHIALDDFGTGYSSLTYLMRLPVGTLKVDKTFIDRMLEDENQARFVGFIIDMAHTLGLTVVAEGVETDSQLAHLAAAGCDCIQGYVFSRPVPEEDALKLLSS